MQGMFRYQRPDNWRLDILGGFLAPQVSIQGSSGTVSVVPRAYEQGYGFALDGLKIIGEYFSARLINDFDYPDVKTNVGKRIITYIKGQATLQIDRRTGTVLTYKDEKVSVDFRTHHLYQGLYIPNEIVLSVPGQRIRATAKFIHILLNESADTTVFSKPAGGVSSPQGTIQ